VDTILNDKSNYFYIDFTEYQKIDNDLPIGIFDSGTGGLTVFDAIVNYDQHNNSTNKFSLLGDSIKDFSKEHFIYLADQANMPYGNYESVNKTKLLKEHIIKDVQFLLDKKYYKSAEDLNYQKDKSRIKALVIACNTATAFGITDIENFIKEAEIDIKVIGVIGAGVKAALETINKEDTAAIAIMATAGTVASNGYPNEIKHQLKMRNFKNDIAIYQQAGIGLAGAIDGVIDFIDYDASSPREEYKGPSDKNDELKINVNLLERYNFDWTKNKMLYNGDVDNPYDIQINSVENYISYYVTTLLEQIRLSEENTKLKSIILGCTHYPFYTEIFKSKIDWLRNYKEKENYIYKDFMEDEITFIDPALYTAKELYAYLNANKLFANSSLEKSEFYISVPNITNQNVDIDKSGNFTYDYKYGRDADIIQQYVKHVPFSRRNIPEETISRLSETIPYTFELISNFNLNNNKTSFLKDEEKIVTE
jgi:glutamate racemase